MNSGFRVVFLKKKWLKGVVFLFNYNYENEEKVQRTEN